MAVPFLAAAADGIPYEVIFFLVAGAITLISKLHEKAKKVRAESIANEQREEARERMDLPGLEPAVRRPASPSVRRVNAGRQNTITAPDVSTGPSQKRGTVPTRHLKRSMATERAVATVDENYQTQLDPVHSVITRLRKDRNTLRQAILLREIIGPPVALRGRHRPGTW